MTDSNKSSYLTGSLLTLALAGLLSCNSSDRAQTTTQPTAESWTMLNFTKVDSANPIMGPSMVGRFVDPIAKQPVLWEEKDVFNPAVVVKDGKIYMLYRAENKVGALEKASRIGLATSTDGIHFTRMKEPVLYPDNDAQKKYEWPGGTEDPRVVESDDHTYYMTYTAYDGALARLQVASSKDLLHWTKYGSVFNDVADGKYVDKWSKSGSIVSRYEPDGRIVATKIKGKYWMYWGDAQIWLATSDDLIHWTPLEMAAGEKPPVPLRAQALTLPNLKIVLPTREGKFDSDLVESGPPAMLTDKGILLIYNSRNVPAIGDKSLPEGTYTAAQALFDKNDPATLLNRTDTYFMRPEKPYETTGQVNQVVFLEGLARYNSKWFLYYGTADSKIAVATRPVE
ncbi:glycoside hydrolase family 130 protein [Hymenobacter sp. GOD-10R]|uniref:glycoside hydrolase family 130 protein n=1 Tax=Hymenobacter sp. GOD-10R TaxID=3093922 RepID=UPI002D79515E|nr:glycoside hydrolase family 130 protein [Hymenobacter sp. GOD-10R]WRQ29344.1 glycoside hydrolase family 130 protein [Hymenobacter sp. GOD-10R]